MTKNGKLLIENKEKYDLFDDPLNDFEWIEDIPERLRNSDVCPICGGIVLIQGRCRTCVDCGWSLCDV